MWHLNSAVSLFRSSTFALCAESKSCHMLSIPINRPLELAPSRGALAQQQILRMKLTMNDNIQYKAPNVNCSSSTNNSLRVMETCNADCQTVLKMICMQHGEHDRLMRHKLIKFLLVKIHIARTWSRGVSVCWFERWLLIQQGISERCIHSELCSVNRLNPVPLVSTSKLNRLWVQRCWRGNLLMLIFHDCSVHIDYDDECGMHMLSGMCCIWIAGHTNSTSLQTNGFASAVPKLYTWGWWWQLRLVKIQYYNLL